VDRQAARAATIEKVIKRYENRKLYDPAARRYVTMADLSKMVGRGDEVRVEDQRTGDDITTTVLAQVLLEGLKQRTTHVPRQVFARLIRVGLTGTLKAALPAAPDVASRAKEEAERIASGLLSRGRLSLEEAVSLRQEIAGSIQRLAAEVQRGIESHIHGLLRPDGGPHTQVSLEGLRERLLAFETYLQAPRRRRTRR